MSTPSNPMRFGANSALASPAYDDLFLPVYGGEVLTRFPEYLGVSAKLRQKSIMTGNEARFPRLGGLGAERHAVGTKLLGLDTDQSEVRIFLDERPLVSHFRVDDIDTAMAHYETRSEMSNQAAQALAEAQDRYSLRLLINASRATPSSVYGGANSPFPGGGMDGAGTARNVDMQNTPGATPTADQIGNFLSAIDAQIVRWDNLRVPFDKRHVYVDVAFWHALRQFGAPRSAATLGYVPMFMAADGTYGAQANPGQFLGQMVDFNTPLQFNGVLIWRTNLLPNGQDLSNDDEPKYQGNFTNTRAIMFQESAVGLVFKMALQTEADRDVSRRDWLFVSAMLSGGGTLRPECACEFVDNN